MLSGPVAGADTAVRMTAVRRRRRPGSVEQAHSRRRRAEQPVYYAPDQATDLVIS